MPTYLVEDPQTGLKAELQGDSPPTEAELSEIFDQLSAQGKPAEGVMARIGKSMRDSTNVRPGFNPYAQWGGKMEVEPGAFLPAFEPPEAVKKAIDKAVPSFEPETPQVAQLIQMLGLEPARQAAAEVSSRIKGALGTVLSPGGAGLALAAPMAPGLVGGVVATTSVPGVIEGVKEVARGIREDSPASIAGGSTDALLGGLGVLGGGLGVTKAALKASNIPRVMEAPRPAPSPEPTTPLVPIERRLPAPRTRMPEFTESTLEPGGPPSRALPAPGESGATRATLPESPLGPRTEGYRITLPIEPETAVRARQVWSKPIDIEAQVVGADALRQIVSFTEEQKVAGKPYQPPSISTDLRQLERVMQRNTVSKVESWANEVLDRKMREVGANPFFDPEFLAAATVKGAILVKRGVVNFADWSNEMRKQFGRGMDDRLPDLFKQAMDTYGHSAATGGIKNAIQERSAAPFSLEAPPQGGQTMGAQVRTGEEPALPQKPSEQLGEQVPPKEPLGDVNKPVPPAPEQAPQTAAPTAAAVSSAKPPGVTAPEVPPAISEATTQVAQTQTKPFAFDSLEPTSQNLGIATTLSQSVDAVLAKAKSSILKNWRTRGHLPKETYELKKQNDHIKSALNHSIKVTNNALTKAIQEHYGKRLFGRRIPKAAIEAMDQYLHGYVSNQNAIPDSIRRVLDTQRAELDGFTDKIIDLWHRELVKHPTGSDRYQKIADFIDLMRGNKGIYVNRSYEFFDAKEKPKYWYSKLPEGVRMTAEKYLMDNSPVPLTADEAKLNLLKWLSDLQETPGFGTTKLGSKDLSIFMKRKVIAPEIRAVLGEYHNPFVNYAKSMTKMGGWVANQNFLNEVRRQGMGRFLFEEGAKTPPEYHVKIAGESSDTMSPLNGLRTTQEIADAFREFDAIHKTGPLARSFLAMNGWAKQMATTHSVMTQAGNLISRPFMAGMAGHLNVLNLPKSIRLVVDDLLAKDSPTVKMLYEEGVLGDTANWGEVKAALRDAAMEDVAPNDLVSWSMLRALKKYTIEIPQEIYRVSDELGNVFGWLAERENQREINPALSPEQLNRKAAQATRKLYPYYSETPKAIQAFRRLPTGPFVTFQYQMYRNTVNALTMTLNELRSANPAERRVGLKRAASQIATLATPWILAEASKAMLGISKQQEEDFRRTRRSWDKNSKWMFTDVDPQKGELTGYNVSFRDPYSGITDPIVAIISGIIKGDDPFQIILNATKEAANAWTSEQIFWKAAGEAWMGQTKTGRKLFNETDSEAEKTLKRVDHLMDALKPGTWQRAERRLLPAFRNEQPEHGQQLDPAKEVVREMGFALETVNYNRWLANQSFNFKKMDADAEGVFHKTISRTQTTTPDDLLAAYKEADSRRFKIWKELRKDFMAAVRNGVPVVEAQKTMIEHGITKNDVAAISSGTYVPMKISEQAMAKAKNRNRELPIDAIGQYMSTVIGTSLDETQR